MENSIFDIEVMPQFETPTLKEGNGDMDESSEEYIDRMFKQVSSENVFCRGLKTNVRNYIDISVQNHLKVHNSKESFYESELIKQYKERIEFLEREMKNKDNVIDKLMQNISQFTKGMIQQNISISKKEISTRDASRKVNLEKSKQSFSNDILTKDDIKEAKENDKNINELEIQLKNVRHEYHERFIKQNNSNDTSDVVRKKQLLLIGDSMLNGINEKSLLNKNVEVNMKYFSGAKIKDLNNRLDTLLEEKPDIVVMHVGTNNTPHMASNEDTDELLQLKHRIERTLPNTEVIISSLITRSDDGKANITIKKVNRHLNQLKINIMDNDNITHQDLGKKGLHLSKFGKAKFAKNLINKMKEIS